MVTRAALGAVLRIAVVVGLYFLLPLERGESRMWLALGLGLLGFGALVAWEAYAVLTSPHPVLRGVQALAVAVPLFLVVFAGLYFELEHIVPGSMSEPLTKVDALYFTVTVAATVGFGDIAPVSSTARVLTTINMVGNLAVLGAAVRLLMAAAKQRQTAEQPTS